MSRLDLRCRGDRELEAKLLTDETVRATVAEHAAAKDLGARRDLLATALRMTRSLSPRLDGLIEACRARLGIETAVEAYVYPESHFNAACVKPQEGRVFVLFSSALFEAFDDEELRFVIGHELGHHLFEHHRLPLKKLLESSTLGVTATQLFAWSRYAEISADRAGMVCAGTLDAVTRSLLKLASGLKVGLANVSAAEFLGQLGDLREELERHHAQEQRPDWFATHPFSPLRLSAAERFSRSAQFAGTGSGLEELEAGVGELMSLMEPTYLHDKTEVAELMRRLLLAGGVLVAAANGQIDTAERVALEKFFGPGSCAHPNVEALRKDLDRRVADVKARVPAMRRSQVMRDLCVVALADGLVDPSERAVLDDLARRIEVDPALIERTLASPPRLD